MLFTGGLQTLKKYVEYNSVKRSQTINICMEAQTYRKLSLLNVIPILFHIF